MSKIYVSVVESEATVVIITGIPVEGGGTTNFDDLDNRPKYGGEVMTHETDIPIVEPATTPDLQAVTEAGNTTSKRIVVRQKDDFSDLSSTLHETGFETQLTHSDEDRTESLYTQLSVGDGLYSATDRTRGERSTLYLCKISGQELSIQYQDNDKARHFILSVENASIDSDDDTKAAWQNYVGIGDIASALDKINGEVI
jgi:hypothetical protein